MLRVRIVLEALVSHPAPLALGPLIPSLDLVHVVYVLLVHIVQEGYHIHVLLVRINQIITKQVV